MSILIGFAIYAVLFLSYVTVFGVLSLRTAKEMPKTITIVQACPAPVQEPSIVPVNSL